MATPLPRKAALVAMAPALEVEELGAFWPTDEDAAAWVVGAVPALLVVVPLEPPPTWALEGSRVPHLLLMLFLHSSCALALAVLAATQSE